MDPLISASDLVEIAADTVICDVRWRLNDPDLGRQLYRKAHIPGAIFVDLDTDLSDPPGDRGRHPLPTADRFRTTLGKLGIGAGARVVAYDDLSGLVAARLWWMLRSIGHERVQVLNGGLAAWEAAGLPVESDVNRPAPTEYEGEDDFTGVVDIAELDGRELVDVRAQERYRGEVEPVDPRPGHIPGAVNRPVASMLDDDGTLRSAAELRAIFEQTAEPVMACGSGVNASFAALAHEVAHGSLPDIYPGSYSEWSRSDRPVHTGDEP